MRCIQVFLVIVLAGQTREFGDHDRARRGLGPVTSSQELILRIQKSFDCVSLPFVRVLLFWAQNVFK